MKILTVIAYIAGLIILAIIGGLLSMSYDKNITKQAIREYEEEKRRIEDYEAALQEIDDLEQEMNEKSRE